MDNLDKISDLLNIKKSRFGSTILLMIVLFIIFNIELMNFTVTAIIYIFAIYYVGNNLDTLITNE